MFWGRSLESAKVSKDHESIQSNATPDQGYIIGKGQEHKTHHLRDSQEVSPFSVGEYKAARSRQDSMTNTNNKKDPQKNYRLGTVSKSNYWRA